MESIISTASEDLLVAPIDFSIGKNTAQYVTAREQVTYFSSQNIVSPTGVRVAKFQVGNPTAFLDLSSLYFAFELTNLGSSAMKPLTAEAHCLFSRLIVKAAGQLVENIELMNVQEEYVRRILPLEKRKNLSNMFLGSTGGDDGHDLEANTLAGGHSRTVLFRPMTSSVLNLKKFWPALLLGAQGLTFELECAIPGEAMQSAASTYQLTNLRILLDVVSLTSELTDQYTSLLLTGKSVFLELEQSEATQHFLPGTSSKFSISSARQFSRLNTFIAIFQQAPTAGQIVEQQVNNFYLPASAGATLETNLVINGQRQPAFNNKGTAEHWIRYLRGVGAYANIGTSTAISLDSFQGVVNSGGADTPGRSFSVCFDLEKLPGHASHTGTPIDSGGIINLHVIGAGEVSGEYVDRVILMHHFSSVLEIRDSGVTLYT